MKDKDKELEELEKQLHKNIEEMYGKEMLEQFKSNVEDKESKDQEVEMLRVFMEDSKLNFGLDYHLDEEYGRLNLYPDGVDNQMENINLKYNQYAKRIYVSGHGDKTSVSYVCKPTQDEVNYCLMTVIDQFRKDNEWTWEMPCEIRYKTQNN
jgi:hypothetical protein